MLKNIIDKYRYLLLLTVSLFLFVVVFISYAYPEGDEAVFGFLKRYEVELSAPVKGRIIKNGIPISGMEIVRELSYGGYDKGEPVIDYALTDTNGEFSFKEVKVKSNAPGNIFGQDARLRQEIYIKKDLDEIKDGEDKYYWLWFISKNWTSVPYLNQYLMQLNADLQNKELQYEVDLTQFGLRSSQPIASICYWEGELFSVYYGENLEEIKSFDDLKD
ncbi:MULTISPECIES: DUF6795 domain-containing protein [unclassified Shewanella]|uniref:DUF6795 domain-containing protein n=1 Tax=unclassified Shewanella TaxID=196818 RepID=UPI00137BA72A|nr:MULTISPECIES: DUF6795 domain-containing protein [unclassified Shewanella]MBB1364681.1 hypothetical protein [Shewanella sp. SR44-4]QHS12465.1 hypothetical protein GUY17_04710 [Shewanella sp. Arc9-LZ]